MSKLVPKRRDGGWPAAEWVLKAQWDAQQEIPHARLVILRDIATHPLNVHYNTEGQLKVGRLFAQAFLNSSLRIGGHTPQKILAMLGAKGREVVKESKLAMSPNATTLAGWLRTATGTRGRYPTAHFRSICLHDSTGGFQATPQRRLYTPQRTSNY